MNWINVYSEWYKDLTRYEVLVVGEKDKKIFKAANVFPPDVAVQKVVIWINEKLEEYNKL